MWCGSKIVTADRPDHAARVQNGQLRLTRYKACERGAPNLRELVWHDGHSAECAQRRPATAALLNETGGFGMAELLKGFLAWEA